MEPHIQYSRTSDGVSIPYAAPRNRGADTYVINADGRSQSRLTREPANDLWPRWSPQR